MTKLTNRTAPLDCRNRPCSPDCNARSCPDIAERLEKLKRYEDAEEQGRLVVLPCKKGDEIFVINGWYQRTIATKTVHHIKVFDSDFTRFVIETEDCQVYVWGKSAFETKEEAEAAMKEDKK